MNTWRVLISLLLGGIVLWRNLAGALLCIKPTLIRIRPRPETAHEVDSNVFQAMEDELSPLGFRRLGAHLESAPMRPAVLYYDFVSDADQTYASAFYEGDSARLVLITPLDGAFVLTADHKRHGADEPDYLAGGLPHAEPEQLLAAHRRRVDRLRQAGRVPRAEPTLEGRVAAARAWLEGPGGREVRLRYVNNLLLGLIGVVLIGAVLVGWIRALG